MKAIITGASGTVGRALHERLRAARVFHQYDQRLLDDRLAVPPLRSRLPSL